MDNKPKVKKEPEEEVVKADEPTTYQNPYTQIKTLNLPQSILRYNDSGFPDNGEPYTFDGASLKINLLRKYMVQ